VVPLTVLQRLPGTGDTIELRTMQVVTDSSSTLYGFMSALERTLFQRLLTASGIGGKVALAMMSTFPAERLARAIVEKDTVALRQVPGIGKKTAEKLVVELSDRVADLAVASTPAGRDLGAAQEAVQALVSLGYSFGDADKAVRRALEAGPVGSTEELIRRALTE
jgi:Holliday junction DNA helicase RuvA